MRDPRAYSLALGATGGIIGVFAYVIAGATGLGVGLVAYAVGVAMGLMA